MEICSDQNDADNFRSRIDEVGQLIDADADNFRSRIDEVGQLIDAEGFVEPVEVKSHLIWPVEVEPRQSFERLDGADERLNEAGRE